MSATALIWLFSAACLLLLSFRRPVWAIALYMLTFFAAPQNWWWGDEIPQLRYALWAGVILLVSTIIYRAQSPDDEGHRWTRVHKAAIVMAVNATLVHLLIAVDPVISLDTYVELLKYCLLFYLIWIGIRDKRDFRTAIMAIALGGLYIGWEITINERGDFSGSRLEGVGAPGADTANSLANLMLTCLPLISSLLVMGSARDKIVAHFGGAARAQCPPPLQQPRRVSRTHGHRNRVSGHCPGQDAETALKSLASGQLSRCISCSATRRSWIASPPPSSAAKSGTIPLESRFVFWQAGARMLNDYPLGAGGGAFKFNLGRRYQASIVGAQNAQDRSLHNGYLTEATDWGIQGLAIKLFMFIAALVPRVSGRPSSAAWKDARRKPSPGFAC